jgi:DNA-binding transcriptional LysR family regulator
MFAQGEQDQRRAMNREQLLAFVRIAHEGSFSRAAQQLAIAQPTISARIKTLEQEVGGPLFTRRGPRVMLTERGRNFLPYAARALTALAEGLGAARPGASGRHGKLSIGTIQSLAGGFLAAAIADFHAGHPAVEIVVRSGHSAEILARLEDGSVGLGLITWPYYPANVSPLLRFREPLGLFVPAAHPPAWQGIRTLADIGTAETPFLLVRWGLSFNPVLARALAHAEAVLEVPIDTVLALLRRGLGAAFLPRALVRDDLVAGRVVEVALVDALPGYRETALVCLGGASGLASPLLDFVAILSAQARRFGVSESS